jgi:DNA end-binding protein Ku
MRAIWTGSLSFGLINIPVKVYSASEERALKFRLLDKHGNCPISYAKVCRLHNREVKYEDIVKGYEYQKGDFVILTDEDFKIAAPRKTRTIDIISFVPEEEVPSKAIDKPYFIEPDERTEKAYVLLREALKRAGQVGLAKVVFRNKEHIAMVKPEDKALMLITLRYADELREPKELNLPEKAEYSEKELNMALMLIDQLKDHFKAETYHDTYTEALKELIDKKAEGKPIKVADEPDAKTTNMRNLMDILQKSLENERAKRQTSAR